MAANYQLMIMQSLDAMNIISNFYIVYVAFVDYRTNSVSQPWSWVGIIIISSPLLYNKYL